MVLLEDHQRLLAEKRTFQEEIEKRDVENNRLRLEFTSEIDRLRLELTVAASARFLSHVERSDKAPIPPAPPATTSAAQPVAPLMALDPIDVLSAARAAATLAEKEKAADAIARAEAAISEASAEQQTWLTKLSETKTKRDAAGKQLQGTEQHLKEQRNVLAKVKLKSDAILDARDACGREYHRSARDCGVDDPDAILARILMNPEMEQAGAKLREYAQLQVNFKELEGERIAQDAKIRVCEARLTAEAAQKRSLDEQVTTQKMHADTCASCLEGSLAIALDRAPRKPWQWRLRPTSSWPTSTLPAGPSPGLERPRMTFSSRPWRIYHSYCWTTARASVQ